MGAENGSDVAEGATPHERPNQGWPGLFRELREARLAHPVYNFYGGWGRKRWLTYFAAWIVVFWAGMYVFGGFVFDQSWFWLGIWFALAVSFVTWLWVRAYEEFQIREGWGGRRLEMPGKTAEDDN